MVEDVTPGRSRRFRIVLILSLAANLLFIGLMVGAVMRHGHDGPRYRDRPPSVGAALFRALPREDKREIREAMHQRDSLVRDAERQSDFAEIRALLVAEPFDAAALEDAMRRQIDKRHDFIEQAQVDWVARIAAMDAGERAEYVERLDRVIEEKTSRTKP
ncbi:periplasmic heavy metal sensor [Sulfitobacter sp. BDSS02]|nr:periplasmic heavy metal sensor [Sulfitobacter sp. BDSS02]MBR9849151.1 periplasmic heavy metal sensor [Paracoccaceae bacterium]